MNLMPNITCLSSIGFLRQSKWLLQFKVESAFLELLVFVRVEAEQLRRTMSPCHLGFFERHEQIKAQDLLAEVALVQLRAEHRFIKMLELRKRKLGWQQLESDGLVAHLAFQPVQRRGKNLGVIERQLWRF